MVVVEAMAFAKPVLCSRYAGVKEIVQNGKNGFIFDPLKPEELAGLMAQYILNPTLVGEFGSVSARIMEYYTPQRSAQILADVAFGVAAK